MNKYISVGKILNFHGIRGEAKVGYSKNQEDFITSLESVYVKLNSDYISLKIESCRINKNHAIMKFSTINSIDDLLPYKGKLLFVDENTIRSNLSEDEFLIDELVGLKVYDAKDNKNLGIIIGVSNNGATDLLSVKTNNNQVHFIPFVKAIVTDVNLKTKRVVINNLEGLLT